MVIIPFCSNQTADFFSCGMPRGRSAPSLHITIHPDSLRSDRRASIFPVQWIWEKEAVVEKALSVPNFLPGLTKNLTGRSDRARAGGSLMVAAQGLEPRTRGL
jgi:hypothetical protein